MPPKKKVQKMALNDFFANGGGADVGNWADDDDIVLPSAPAPKDPSAPKRGDPGYLDSMPDRSSRFGSGPPRADVPLPTAPPYTAYIGGLAYETSESELLDAFASIGATTSRLVKEPGTTKSKGFGYVEFSSVDGLKQALDRSGEQLQGRSIRVSVAEPPSSKRDFGPSAAEESSQWRRSGPLPTREAAPVPGGARRGPAFASPSAEGGPERDWGAARGAKFVPGQPAAGVPPVRRENSGPGFRREEAPHAHAPSQADDASAWRSSRPTVEAPVQPAPHREFAPREGREGREVSSPGLADTEATWSRGTKIRAAPPPAAAQQDAPSPNPAVEREWRRPEASRQASEEVSAAPAAPAERKKLALAPRGAATGASTPEGASTTDASASAAPSPRSSIFGGAKPIDSAAKEAAAADKLAEQTKERRAAQAKARAEEEGKAKALADERDKKYRDMQEAALREAGLPVPAASASASASGKPQGQGQGQGQGRGRPAPPHQAGQSQSPSPSQQGQSRSSSVVANVQAAPAPSRNAWAGRGRGAAPAHAQQGRTPPQPHRATSTEDTQSANAPAPKAKREPVQKVVDEDGFEVATGRSRPQQAQAQAQGQGGVPPKEARKGFSFAAAAGGLQDEGEGEGEGVKEVQEGVEGVKI